MSEPSTSVLVVEDERIIARDLQQTLRELGYEVPDIAASAEEAIARASERCPDLVLMDIRIKGKLDGVEAARILHDRFSVPVVFLTAHADQVTLDRAKLTEPYGYLVKPVSTAELRSSVEVAVYRHRMERRLRERERWFSTALRSLADAVIAVDLAGNVSFMNPSAELLTGATAAAALGKPVRETLRLIGTDELPVERALREGKTVELREAQLVNISDGSIRLIADSVSLVMDDGRRLGAVMIFRDVTEQRRLERQLELASRLTSLGTMAAGVAHEINNPLAVVIADTEFVSREVGELQTEVASTSAPLTTQDQRLRTLAAALRDIHAAANRIERIVADLRAFSRPTSTAQGQADVGRSIAWALRATSHEFRHRAKVVTDVGDLPPVGLDETRLGQVLVNLLVNAAQAIAPGHAERNVVAVTARSDDASAVVLEVRDTGEGIPKPLLERIFEPFFTTKEVGVGTGLGLSICHGIVTSVGGSIEAQSELGHGTTIRVRLPVGEPQNPSARPAPTAERPDAGARILVIDDETMLLDAIGRLLREHHVTCADNAETALELIEDGAQFDLVLCDLMMPSMTGIDFYEALLARHPELARRVIFLTGGAIERRAADFLQSVPNHTLFKPFDGNTLRHTVNAILDGLP